MNKLLAVLSLLSLLMACAAPEELPEGQPEDPYSASFAKVDYGSVPESSGTSVPPDSASGGPDGWGDALPVPDADGTTQEFTDVEADEGPLTAPDTQYSEDGFQYECDAPFTTKPCVTECGSTGEHSCVKVWGPCEPPAELCNGVDDDCDGVVDNGVQNVCGGCGDVPSESCNGLDDDCDGDIDEGVANVCGGCGPVPQEVCNGIDDDCNGAVDEGVSNACGGCGPVPQEICNGIDDDCDGIVDGFPFELDLNGDCLYVQCPDYAPFPVGCNIIMQGGDERGCVASKPDSPVVYMQEGNVCGAGNVSGTLTCSCTPGDGLNEQNCPINKEKKYYPSSPSGCPD